MSTENHRIADRRVSNFDFRKNKINKRKFFRRKIDKVNHSIYYIILFVLSAIMIAWACADIFFLMGGK